jgi:23S rRNA (adenine2503-C2)-methyltransferase
MEFPSLLDWTPEDFAQQLHAWGKLKDAPLLPEQIFRGIHQRGQHNLDSIEGVSKRKLAFLARHVCLDVPELLKVESSWDQSARYAFRLADSAIVEAVLIPHHGKWTACVSSQAGCALACQFCATGRLGLKRNLTVSEIVAQVLVLGSHSGYRISDLVFMGMGEPLQNERAVFKACSILSSPLSAQISPKRMVISTAGVVPAIQRFARSDHRMKLVFSLGSAIPEKRLQLMPIQRTYGFEEFLSSIAEYARSRGNRFVTLEYVAISGVTLGQDDLLAIRENLVGRFPFILNVIPMNPVNQSGLTAPTWHEVKEWSEQLRPLGFPVKVRRSAGKDQVAGCGQLGTRLLEEAGL